LQKIPARVARDAAKAALRQEVVLYRGRKDDAQADGQGAVFCDAREQAAALGFRHSIGAEGCVDARQNIRARVERLCEALHNKSIIEQIG